MQRSVGTPGPESGKRRQPWLLVGGLALLACVAGCSSPPRTGEHGGDCGLGRSCAVGLLCGPRGSCITWEETPCGLAPCEAPGVCAHTVDWETVCLCPEGTHPAGDRCVDQALADPCAGIDCTGNGDCVVWYGTDPVCSCDPGWHPAGLACVADDPVHPCAGLPCNGSWGVCSDATGAPVCACDAAAELVGQTCLPAGLPSWTGGATPSRPSGDPGMSFALTWDASEQQPTLFFGEDIEVWRWNGVDWLAVPTVDPPPPRSGYVVAYDEVRRCHVLFGGYGSESLDDTWELRGQQWSQAAPLTRPPAFYSRQMAVYDPVRAAIVMLAGDDQNDTWTFDGSDWSPVLTDPALPRVVSGTLAWNPDRERVTMIFGTEQLETYELDAGGWSQVAWTDALDQRYARMAAAFDPRRSRLLLAGANSQAAPELWVRQPTSYLPERVVPPTRFAVPPYGHGPHLGLIWVPTAETLLLVLVGPDGLETWTGGWTPLWPAEVCDNGVDDDHDGHPDCADPACEAQPCAGGVCTRGQCTP